MTEPATEPTLADVLAAVGRLSVKVDTVNDIVRRVTPDTDREPDAGFRWPQKNLGSISSVLWAKTTDPYVDTEFSSAFERAWAEAVEADKLDPLLRLVDVWWPVAVFWSNPAFARRQLAWMDTHMASGSPAGSWTWHEVIEGQDGHVSAMSSARE